MTISSCNSALDIMFSMLFSSLLATETVLLCFYLFFLIVFKNFPKIPLLIEKAKPRLVLAITIGTPIETPPLTANKTSKVLSA